VSEEKCDYCMGVGACPKCWGRAAIEELKTKLSKAERALRVIHVTGDAHHCRKLADQALLEIEGVTKE
jgi:hypothetical protein